MVLSGVVLYAQSHQVDTRIQYGIVWYGIVQYVWYGMVWYRTVCMVWYGMVSYVIV